MNDIEELKVAAVEFTLAENSFQEARDALMNEVEQKGYHVSVGTVTQYAKTRIAWDRADERLRKAAKRIYKWL